MPNIYAADSANNWKKAKNIFIGNNGSFVEAKEVYVHDGTTWKLAFQLKPLEFLNDVGNAQVGNYYAEDIQSEPSSADAEMRFNTNGEIEVSEGGSAWTSIGSYSPDAPEVGFGTGVEVKVDPTSGTFSSGVTGTWQALTSIRTYRVSAPEPDGLKTCVATVTVRRTGDASSEITATMELYAELEPL